MIIGSIAVLIVIVGSALACSAERCSGRSAAIQISAGILIIGGLALLGAGLEGALNPSILRAG